MKDFIEIAGIRVPCLNRDTNWIPPTEIVLTPTSRRNLQKILPPLLHGQNLLLIGDAGVGKNALLYYINSLRSCPTIRYSFNEDTLPEDLVGAYRIDPLTKNFVWSDGPLAQAIRQGASFVADEVNLSSPELLKRFYSIFTERALELLEGDASRITAHDGFNFVATQNPPQGFAGRKELPREIRKYFSCIYIDPYSMEEQAEILGGLFPALKKEETLALVEMNREIENLLAHHKLGAEDMENYHFNLRNLKRLAKRLSGEGGKKKYWEKELGDIYLRPFRFHREREVIAQKISALGAKHLNHEIHFFDFTGARKNPGLESPSNGTKAKERKKEGSGIRFDLKKKKIHIGRVSLDFMGDSSDDFEKAVQEACNIFPPLPQTFHTLEAMACAIAHKENILLESMADVEAEDYVYFFSRLLGRPLQVITLARGIHTSDIIGALKPVLRQLPQPAKGSEGEPLKNQDETHIEWVGGPLSKALHSESFILLRGLEAAPSELVEKLNMLLDDAQALLLPPESGEREPLLLSDKSRIFAIKYFRTRRSTATISRAFRNRFSAFNIEPLDDPESLLQLIAHFLGLARSKQGAFGEILKVMADFHILLQKQAEEGQLGATRPHPYEFGLSNLRRWCQYIAQENLEDLKLDHSKGKDFLSAAAELSYTNEIADMEERQRALGLLHGLLEGRSLEEFLDLLKELKKKANESTGRIKQSGYKQRIWWDQKKHWRKAETGKFKRKRHGRGLKKGLRINTPETGGNIKEGPDAWYGSDTLGNKGQGEPGGGGGAWGYRTEELYQEFLRKRRSFWSYDLAISFSDYKTHFKPELQNLSSHFEKLLEPNLELKRLYHQRGSRVDARRYLTYISGQGDERIFNKSIAVTEKEQIKDLELLFALNKGRRIFNFEYSFAAVLALLASAYTLQKYHLPFSMAGYSDLDNFKKNFDIVWYKKSQEEWNFKKEEELFSGLVQGWHGDTCEEAPVLESLASGFRKAKARTRILLIFSDFRGFRAKGSPEKELASLELKNFKERVDSLRQEGIVCLGLGLGPRSLAEYIFEESLHIGDESFRILPSLLIEKLSEVIYKHHKASREEKRRKGKRK